MDIFSKKLLLNPAERYTENQVLLNTNTSGSHELDILQKGIYKIEIVGGGGGSATATSWYSYSGKRGNKACASGGSGASFIGEVFLNKGTYTCYCGKFGTTSGMSSEKVNITAQGTSGGASYIALGNTTLISVGGGGGGYAEAGYTNNVLSCTGGTAGSTPVIDSSVAVRTTTLSASGNVGATASKRSTSTSTRPSASTDYTPSKYTPDTQIGRGMASGSGGTDGTIHGGSGLIKITYLRKE